MQAVHIERLRSLYAMMAGIPASVINMDSWRNARLGDTPETKELLQARPGCGTTACALGWATAYPEFIKQGLGFSVQAYEVRYAGEYDFDAGANFFGLSYGQANDLFDPVHSLKPVDHKKVFLIRLRSLMVRLGIITSERSRELLEEENLRDSLEGA